MTPHSAGQLTRLGTRAHRVLRYFHLRLCRPRGNCRITSKTRRVCRRGQHLVTRFRTTTRRLRSHVVDKCGWKTARRDPLRRRAIFPPSLPTKAVVPRDICHRCGPQVAGRNRGSRLRAPPRSRSADDFSRRRRDLPTPLSRKGHPGWHQLTTTDRESRDDSSIERRLTRLTINSSSNLLH